MNEKILLDVQHISKYFPIYSSLLKLKTGEVQAVSDISFQLRKGETIGIVGESGCGKSTMARVLIHAYEPTGDGKIFFNGKDVTNLKGAALKEHRRHIQMIFQDPYASLNPRLRIRSIIAEPLWVNKICSKEEAEHRVPDLLYTVGLNKSDADKFPNQFSGGQRQRICVARSLSLNPELIIADEPTSALDVSIQAQILNLMMELQKTRDLSYIFISHNLAAVKHISDIVGVMYLGKMVELADKQELYHHPFHPYTKALLSVAPVADIDHHAEHIVLKGEIPNPADPPAGCRFHTRCIHCMERCRSEAPEYREVSPGHFAACHLEQA